MSTILKLTQKQPNLIASIVVCLLHDENRALQKKSGAEAGIRGASRVRAGLFLYHSDLLAGGAKRRSRKF
ncbi:hypothetical protein EON65_50200 [archaeon]|nr:MAG: hypothetical protein EON65_50200 [archaeon]